jgi:hypothetical protein
MPQLWAAGLHTVHCVPHLRFTAEAVSACATGTDSGLHPGICLPTSATGVGSTLQGGKGHAWCRGACVHATTMQAEVAAAGASLRPGIWAAKQLMQSICDHRRWGKRQPTFDMQHRLSEHVSLGQVAACMLVSASQPALHK